MNRSILLIYLLIVATFAGWSTEREKVVVIGFDGADHGIVTEMMAEGALPNLSRLAEMGSFAPLLPTNPPQTPVSWSTFATGINPGRTGIYDFIRREPGTYTPDFALRGETTKTVLLGRQNRVVMPIVAFGVVALLVFLLMRIWWQRGAVVAALLLGAGSAVVSWAVFAKWIPENIPAAYTVRQGTPIWDILGQHGKTAEVIRLPVTFPAEPLAGKMISGLAVPDIRGTVGKPSLYTNDPEWVVADNQFSIEIKRFEGEGPYETEILGPPNKLFYDEEAAETARQSGKTYAHPRDFHLPITLRVDGDAVVATIAGTEHRFTVRTWSDWITFRYPVNPLVTLKGAGRFYLDHLRDGRFKLYLTPIHLHPGNPLPLSHPPSLAKKVWDQEPYKTMGWALDTWSIGNDLMDEEHFLEDVRLTVDRYETMMTDFLSNSESDLYIQVFSFTDRVGHVLWRFWDAEHPLYDPVLAARYREAIRDSYRRMDDLVGKAMALVDLEKTLFLVCSDHGFSSWRHQFNYNTWLVKNGYMSLKRNVLGEEMKLDDLENKFTPLDFVDWENTKAYAMALGQIFINLEGREKEGSVAPSEYEAVRQQLRADLLAFVDEHTGANPIREVYFRDQIYTDFDPATTPDLRAATAVNYRVSWDTTLGGMPEALTEPNLRNWSGDHCSNDPRDVPGILFSSVPITREGQPYIGDLCPSILSVLGIEHGIRMDGEILFAR